jgi:hypothetical protein
MNWLAMNDVIMWRHATVGFMQTQPLCVVRDSTGLVFVFHVLELNFCHKSFESNGHLA